MRLVEVSLGGELVRVRDTAEIPPDSHYLTLSHCWVGLLECKLLASNLASYSNAIPRSHLTKTFEDAIHLVSRLGFRYIWIDALCIVQDSKDDWIVEAAKMGDIYTRRTLNLSASAARGGTGGLFHKSAVSYTCVAPIIIQEQGRFSM
jgi:hypothetical protein